MIGLIYYLLLKNDFEINNKLFTEDNRFKGVSGVFEINNQKINHILTFYRVEDGSLKNFLIFLKAFDLWSILNFNDGFI